MLIEGAIAIWLNSFATGVATFVLLNILASIVTNNLGQSFLSLIVGVRVAILWFLALLPWFGALSVISYDLKVSLAASLKLEDYDHWYHMNHFEFLSWHGFLLVSALIFVIYLLICEVYKIFKHRSEIQTLSKLATREIDGYYQLDTEQAIAFTNGFVSCQCFVSSGLIQQTTVEELDIVVQHEKAHAKAYDPLKKWLFSLFANFYLPPFSKRLKLHMTLAIEQIADQKVLQSGIASTLIAATLVKVARLNSKYLPITHSSLVANFAADILEQRVFFLLDQLKLRPVNNVLSVMLIVTGVLLTFLFADSIHLLIESVIHSVESTFNH